MQTPRGEFTRQIMFAQEAENLTITMEGMGGGELTMTYSGTVRGDTMSGELKMRNRTVEWSATKKQN
jgi:hypothetical protein